MLRHVVMFTWDESVDADHVAATAAALNALPNTIDTIRAYAAGPDAGLSAGNADFAVVGDFDDHAGYEVYATHPDHVAVIGEMIKGKITSRVAVQYEV